MIEPVGGGPPVRILGLGGSSRRGSRSLAALRAALALAEAAGAVPVIADVRALDLPFYDEDRSLAAYPPALPWLLDEVRAADGLLLCTPTYLGTVAGAVKNALDLLSVLAGDDPPYLGGKPVGLIALGGTNGADAVTALGHAARCLDGLVVPTSVVVPTRAIDLDGTLLDQGVARRLARMTGEVGDLARRLRRPLPAGVG